MEKLVLVHLSDIHFARSSGVSVHDLDANVRNELRLDAAKIASYVGPVTGVLVTGDIGFSGIKAEYDHATEWLREFCRSIAAPEENVWVVPGNHDVNRELAKRKVTRTLHQGVREDHSDVDRELGEIFSDAQSAAALLEPLAEYNTFAGQFGCSISADKHFWERDLKLSCGTVIRLRGLTSALVSNDRDKRGDMVLGTAQAGIARATGVLHLTLCHHPPDWLRDQDAVEDHLKSKAHIQLFGHKHSQRLDEINGNVRLVAGAMHPERSGRDWVPTYNLLEISRRNSEQIRLRVYQRRWSQPSTSFVAERDPTNGDEHREFLWSMRPETLSNAAEPQGSAIDLSSAVTEGNTIEKDSDAMPPPNHERRLTYRFLTLPFRHQIAVANSLNVLTDEDRALSDEALFRELFKRAAAHGYLYKLWEETEKRHSDPANYNPFQD